MKRSLLIRILYLFSFLGVGLTANAQIQHPGSPWTLQHQTDLKSYAQVVLPNAPENWENQAMEEYLPVKPFLFAWPVDTLIDLVVPANRIFQDPDTEVYQLGFSASFAYSLNIIFNQFVLPEGAQLFLYNPDRSVIWGAYTSENNKKSGKLATSPVPGNEIIIELVLDKTRAPFQPKVVVERISLDLKNVFGNKTGRFGRSGDCNVDINCPPGADWQVLKRSVCKFVRGGTWLCSGALINNTNNDGKALLLTANHTIGLPDHASTSVFYFNYESPECYGGDGRLDHSISGCELLATTNKLDFSLVELSRVPPESFEPYYAGWDRTAVQFYDTVTAIHHPAGDVKKISVANRRVATGSFGGGYDDNTHWKISQWDIGTTEGGSSGSPLFNKNHRIIGDLTGGDAKCSYNFNDYFQKFSVSWDKYPDSSNQLRHWLDPVGSNPLVWNGYDPFSSGKPSANFSYLPEQPLAGKVIRFTDRSIGSPQTWKWTFEEGLPASSVEKNPLIRFDEPGSKQIVLIVGNDFGMDTIRQTIHIESSIDFTISQRKLVQGSETEFTKQVYGDYQDLEWQITEGVQNLDYLEDPLVKDFASLGLVSTKLTVEFPDETKSLYHQNALKVIPDQLIFAGELRSQYLPQEALGTFRLGSNGLIPGTNNLGYDAYANAFYRQSDTAALINGIVVNIYELENSGGAVYLTGAVWDSEWNLLRKDSIRLDPKTMPFKATVWFSQPVGMDTLVYAGFFLPKKDGLKIATGMTLTRNEKNRNDAWGKKGDSWSPLSQAVGLNSALGIQLETTTLYTDYGSQIKIQATSEPGKIVLDLQNLVFDTYELDIYSVDGKKLTTTTSYSGSVVEISYNPVISGVYLLRLRLDTLSFTKKIILLRD